MSITYLTHKNLVDAIDELNLKVMIYFIEASIK